MVRNALGGEIVHDAMCNVCSSHIVGVRYKCMHASCADFDLCQSCEALPFPVHPPTHPLLKMKTTITSVPMVQRQSEGPATSAFATFLDEVEQMVSASQGEAEVPEEQHRQPVLEEEQRSSRHLQDIFDEFVASDTRSPSRALVDAEVSSMHPNLHALFPAETDDEHDFRVSLLKTVAIPDSAFLGPIDDAISGAFPASVTYNSTAGQVEPRTLASPVGSPRFVAEERLIDLEDTCSKEGEQVESDSTLGGGLTTPSDVPASTSSTTSVPRLGPVNNEWRELWPELTSILKHLLQPSTPGDVNSAAVAPVTFREESMPGAMVVEEPKTTEEVETGTAIQESPLVGEPLLCRPLGARSSERPWRAVIDEPVAFNKASFSEKAKVIVEPVRQPSPEIPVSPQPLYASFLSDNNIPDGQIFPPGAEFVKSWRMVNQGMSSWPESTELVFVAGDRLGPFGSAPRAVKVGAVKAGEEVEIAAGEMKAPEIPGRYVSYWRLSDGEGKQFGHSIWVDIIVAEVTRATSSLSTGDNSLASSSVIMPQRADDQGVQSSSFVIERATTVESIHALSTTLPSGSLSEDGSFDSSISLIDAPVSPVSDDEDDEAMYEDSRSHVGPSPVEDVQEIEYVLLYDSSSSEDE